MQLKYNKDEYFQLLKYSKKLKEQGRKLIIEDPDNYYLLLDYQVLLEDHVFWESRNLYYFLMMDFLNENIETAEFCYSFFERCRKDQTLTEKLENDLEQLEKLSSDIRSQNFSTFITDLLSDCEVFEPDSTLREDSQISEEELKDSVKQAVCQMQKYL